MAWMLVEVPDDAPGALSDAELVGAGILLRDHHGEPRDERNTYYRIWCWFLPAYDRARQKWLSDA